MKTVWLLILLIAPVTLQAGIEGPLIKLGVKQLMTVLTAGDDDGQDALERLGGEEGVAKLLEDAFDQGGSNLVDRVVYYGENYGGDALAVISPAPMAMITALDGLDSEGQGIAIRGAARDPQEISNLVVQYGPDVLGVLIQHPGLTKTILDTLSDQALSIGQTLTTQEILVLLSFVEDIEALPEKTEQAFYDLLKKHPSDVVIALEVRPDLLRSGEFSNPVEHLRLLIEEDVPLPDYRAKTKTTFDYLAGSLSSLVMVLAGVWLVSWGLSRFTLSASA